jgi:hypothetical protein
MPNPIRSIYDLMPRQARVRVKSLFPKQALRWYAHRNVDVYLISYPKCGRTWLRLMIGRAISYHFHLPESEDVLFLKSRAKLHPDVPTIAIVHDDRPMLKAPDELEPSKKKFEHKKVVLLVRDPRDVIVSSYFEMKKRSQIFGDNPYEQRDAHFDGSLSEFINRKQGGFDTILRFYNIWAENRNVPNGFLLVRYEDMKKNPQRELRKVLNFIGLEEISDEVLSEAVAYASFENMRKLEEKGQFESGMLIPADKGDPDSYKTRKGKVGGYQEYLSPHEINILNSKMDATLSDFFGYKSSATTGN